MDMDDSRPIRDQAVFPPNLSTRYGLEPFEVSSRTERLTQPTVFLLTLCGQKVAASGTVPHIPPSLGSSGHVQGPLFLQTALENMCQSLRRLEKECPTNSELPTLRRTDEIEGRRVLVTGILLPLPRSGEPRQMLVTVDWTTTDQSNRTPLIRRMKISKRESQVIFWLNQGMTNKEIANQLSISRETVKEYLKRIMKKTNSRTRAGILGRMRLTLD